MSKKAKQEAEKAALRKQREEDFSVLQKRFFAAERLTDAGEKLLEMTAVCVAAHTAQDAMKPGYSGYDAIRPIVWGMTGASVPMTAGVILGTALNPAFIFLIIGSVPGLWGGMASGFKKTDRIREKGKARAAVENADLFAAFEGIRKKSGTAVEELKTHVEEIARSFVRDKVFEQYPDLKEAFTQTALKKISAEKPEPELTARERFGLGQ